MGEALIALGRILGEIDGEGEGVGLEGGEGFLDEGVEAADVLR